METLTGRFGKDSILRHPRIYKALSKRMKAYWAILSNEESCKNDSDLSDLWINGWYKFQGLSYRRKVNA